jgi:lipid II:glycine glycyltransferase (peptidoglycan interpeptide bridge formation enzyme)
MTNVEVDVPATRFYECAASFAEFHLYQTPAFSAVMASTQGARASNLVVIKEGVPIGACAVRIKTLPLIGCGVAYSLGGPLWQRPEATAADLSDVLRAIWGEYGDRRRLSVWLRPRIWRESAASDTLLAAFQANGFNASASQRLPQTLLVDLRPTVDEIRQRLHRSWRRYLLKAERNGLEVSTDRSDASFAAFLPLYDELKRAKGFHGIDENAMRRVNAALPAQLCMETTLCRRSGRIVAGQIASQLGDTCLGIIGGASTEGRECHAAYLVWWERLLRAKESGCLWYDTGGYDDESNPSVAEAKMRIGGQIATFLGEFRRDPSPRRAWLVRQVEALRSMLLRRRYNVALWRRGSTFLGGL